MSRLRAKFAAIIIISLLFSVALISIKAGNSDSQSSGRFSISYISHDSIIINGDSGFTNASGVVWGNGSSSNPYIIEGWDLHSASYPYYGLHISNTIKHVVVRNIFLNQSIVLLDNVENVTIDRLNSEYPGSFSMEPIIEIKDSQNTTLNDSTVSGYFSGISIKNSVNVLINNSIISAQTLGGGAGDPLTFGNCDSITISNNVIGGITGIIANNSREILMKSNSIAGEDYGVHLSGCSNSSIINNSIPGSTSTYIGLNLTDSNNFTISGNTIIASGIEFGQFRIACISLWNSRDNIVYHNNFVATSGSCLAIDNLADENEWDNGYPSGGNYWSTYSGVDQMNGPLQDISGSDGIGDTPYAIDGDSSDRYPLMSSYPIPEFLDLMSPIFVMLCVVILIGIGYRNRER